MTTAVQILSQPLALANGATIPNRFAKSAMSETLGTIHNRMTQDLVTLYRTWAANESASGTHKKSPGIKPGLFLS